LLDRGGDKVLLKRREGNRAPGLKCKNLRDLRAAALDDFGRLEEQPGAFGGRRLGPRREGFGGSVDCSRRFWATTSATRA